MLEQVAYNGFDRTVVELPFLWDNLLKPLQKRPWPVEAARYKLTIALKFEYGFD